MIGRDLVRLLQDVSKIPAFAQLWRDILNRPDKMGAPGFAGVWQLLGTRTPRVYLASRLSPDMETWLMFLMRNVRALMSSLAHLYTNYPFATLFFFSAYALFLVNSQVKMGNQKRYQAWFAARFLATPESESLVCDLIRYICTCYHPSNAVLSSDIIPRWAVLGWLLTCVRVCAIHLSVICCVTVSVFSLSFESTI